jgi:hypothetical protein
VVLYLYFQRPSMLPFRHLHLTVTNPFDGSARTPPSSEITPLPCLWASCSRCSETTNALLGRRSRESGNESARCHRQATADGELKTEQQTGPRRRICSSAKLEAGKHRRRCRCDTFIKTGSPGTQVAGVQRSEPSPPGAKSTLNSSTQYRRGHARETGLSQRTGSQAKSRANTRRRLYQGPPLYLRQSKGR